MSSTPRDLVMNHPISRRDFFDGMALGCVVTERSRETACSPEPFTVRGGAAEALSVPHALRDGRFWRHAGRPEPTGESYDLVVVGGGTSGVSAAREWLRRRPRDGVLVLDNHDRISSPGRPRFGPPEDGVMCDRESFGSDTLVRLTSGWSARLPIAERARQDLLMLHRDPPDWLPGLSAEEKQERLAGLTYSRFLLEVCGAHPDVERFCRTMSCRAWGYDTRAFGAIDAWGTGYPGFEGLGLDRDKPSRFNSPTVKEGPVEAGPLPLDGRVLFRPSSPVVSVRDGASSATVGYFDGHRVMTVEAGAVVLACWSAVIPYLVPDLPLDQRRALSLAVRVPLLHATVRVRDRGAWRRVGVRRVRWTGAYWCLSELAPPSEVRLLATPCRSELGPDKGSVAGRRELFRTPYSQLEHTVRDQLDRLLGPGGFDPARDIEAITVDRWGHGRAPEYCRPWHTFYPDGPFPADVARRRFGRIAIAGSDSEPEPGGAVTAALRAVDELAPVRP
ncbi:NAD(P)-binding protein [Nonomuraea sp. CA-141351]|uniref:NAD(P)-binding protein n=1 Tax=Nonomuraea sp. CA-141351 TaxID=3239996 RepID=UPI003D918E2F